MLTLKFSQSKKKNEFKALAELIDEYEHHDLMPIFIADRGFFAYNVFAHAIENKSFFLIRAKDKNMMRLTGSSIDELPDDLDISVTRILTRSASKKNRKRPDKPDASFINRRRCNQTELWKYHGIYAKMILVNCMHGGKGKRHRDALCLCRWKGR